MRHFLTPFLALAGLTLPAWAGFQFDSIDGGVIDLDAHAGKPVLVVNTASQCGYTGQYAGLQELHEIYGPQGLLVLAVPSDDFNQELSSEAEVKEFCEINFGLTLPMTEITPVKGGDAHPFYRWLSAEKGFVPRWNFNKVLLDGQGEMVAHFGSTVRPTSQKLTRKIEALIAE